MANDLAALAGTWQADPAALAIFAEAVAQEDFDHKDLANAQGIFQHLWTMFQNRPPEHVRVDCVSSAEHPDQATLTIHMRQMPFISDSVYAALRQEQIDIDAIINAGIKARRDDEGNLLAVYPDEDYGPDLEDEKILYLEISLKDGTIDTKALTEKVLHVLFDVSAAVHDWHAMEAQIADTVNDLHDMDNSIVNHDDALEAAQFLTFLQQRHFTFLGYREHALRSDKKDVLHFDIHKNKSLGILRDDSVLLFDSLIVDEQVPQEVRDFLRAPNPVMIVLKGNRRSHVHRPVHVDVIMLKIYNAKGQVEALRLFAGLFTAACYARSTEQIPFVRRKVADILTRSGFETDSHRWRSLKHILDTYPRDELFQIDTDLLHQHALDIQRLYNRPGVGLLVRPDVLHRFVSCLVYLPKEFYDTRLRLKIQRLLEDQLQGQQIDHYVLLNEHSLVRLQYVIGVPGIQLPTIDMPKLQQLVQQASTDWFTQLKTATVEQHGKTQALALLQNLQAAFSLSYQDRVAIPDALTDLPWLQSVLRDKDRVVHLYHEATEPADVYHFKIYVREQEASLSQILPVLDYMGFKTEKEYSYEITPSDNLPRVWVHELIGTIANFTPDQLPAIQTVFADAFLAGWQQQADSDRFNALVTYAGLHWREALIFRTLARFLDLAQYPLGKSYMAQCLITYPAITRLLCDFFLQRHRPHQTLEDAKLKCDTLQAQILTALDDVEKLDDDKVLRSMLSLIQNSLRTNYYHKDAMGGPLDYLSIKFDSEQLTDLPQPRLKKEIFIYSRRVEAVHLRGGDIARGGIRWSDRFEDFRTEVLGLVKAQMVKNTVIVPVGAKGGFICKQISRFTTPPERQGEAIECYKIMMRALLALTDNIVGGKNIPPAGTFCWDAPDPYLVVAADKGTASFSDIANALSIEHNFWLGDAFASGGSKGYDHKQMGITAKGAWECIKRHFRELGKDIQTTSFSVAGVGDMSGDVFGNGLLLSPHAKLIAAFDHRHIFIDPNPDSVKSLAERQRMFALPTSSWMDYNAKLLSTGGGVFSRQEKAIALSSEAQQALGMTQAKVTPGELIQAILKSPVELLYFGGIGTYLKASTQSHEQAGDKANDPNRINAKDVRAKVIGEGANLAMTQEARIEFAHGGGKLNTDFVDNSAGVDTSDHEVNIKIALQSLIERNMINEDQRIALLGEMTNDVASYVLQDNYDQSLALSLVEQQGVEVLPQHIQLIRDFERMGFLQRKIEGLPDDETLNGMQQRLQSLPRPDLAVLLAYAKMQLYKDILASNVPDVPELDYQLMEYFPQALSTKFPAAITQHTLRRNIIATEITNVVVNRMGPSFAHRDSQRLNISSAVVAEAWLLVRSVFDLRSVWQAIDALDNKLPAAEQMALYRVITDAMADATKWILHQHGAQLDLATLLPLYRGKAQQLQNWLGQNAMLDTSTYPATLGEPLKQQLSFLPFLTASCDITALCEAHAYPFETVAELYFALQKRLQTPALLKAVGDLPVDSVWTEEVQENLADDLRLSLQRLAETALRNQVTDIAPWLEQQAPSLKNVDAVLKDLPGQVIHVNILTVAAQRLRILSDRMNATTP